MHVKPLVLLAGLLAALAMAIPWPPTRKETAANNKVFSLGEIVVTGQNEDDHQNKHQ